MNLYYSENITLKNNTITIQSVYSSDKITYTIQDAKKLVKELNRVLRTFDV